MIEQRISATAQPVPFTPTAASHVTFSVLTPTEAEHDRLGIELFRHNLVPPSQDTYRAKMIDEIFTLYGDEVGEEKAALLDSYWQSEDAHTELLTAWHAQERQRALDEAAGAPARAPLPMPVKLMGVRDRSRALLLSEELRGISRPLRDLTVDMQNYSHKQRSGVARMLVQGWTGAATPYLYEDGIVPLETWQALYAEIGREAISQVEDFAMTAGIITKEEEGNSVSPLETEPTTELSPAPSGEPAPNDGNSTTSSITPIPAGASDPITTDASTFTSRLTGETLTTGAIQPAPSPARPEGSMLR